jgi:hypothetical protein
VGGQKGGGAKGNSFEEMMRHRVAGVGLTVAS